MMNKQIDFWVGSDAVCRSDNPWPLDKSRKNQNLANSRARPAKCSNEVLAAPARGRLIEVQETKVVAVGSQEFQVVEERYPKGCAAREEDVFDRMRNQSQRRRSGQPPLTVHQVAAGRAYRDLHEKIEGFGMKGSTAFDSGPMRSPDGGAHLSAMDVFIRDRERLAMFHRAIGGATAKDIKRNVPAREGKTVIGNVQLRQIGKSIITVRALVDQVCIGDRSLSEILRVHGWQANGKNLEPVRIALQEALGRMQGI